MQQLFGLINKVLAQSPATAKRRLRIVTYKVHIFSQHPEACHSRPKALAHQ
jgi:phosphatidylinositol kinase/protein kinase (PI-3  family)